MYSEPRSTYYTLTVLVCVILFLPVTSTLVLNRRDIPKGDISSHVPLIATRLTLDKFFKETISESASDDTTEWQDIINVKTNRIQEGPTPKSTDTIDNKPGGKTPDVKTYSGPSLASFTRGDTGLATDHHKSALIEDSKPCVPDVERSSDLQTIEFTCTSATVKGIHEITDTWIYILAVQTSFNLAKCSVHIAADSSFAPGQSVQTRIFVESKDVPSVMNKLESGKLAAGVMGESIYLHVSNPVVTTVSKVVKKDDFEQIESWLLWSV